MQKIYKIKIANKEIDILQDVDGKFIIPTFIREFESYGTGLKPANEPICLARKPISEKNIAENVLKWGTGGLNIDEGRIETNDNLFGGAYSGNTKKLVKDIYGDYNKLKPNNYKQPKGRFPSNVILNEQVAEMLDQQVGKKKSGFMKKGTKRQNNPNTKNTYGEYKPDEVENNTYGDSGGVSRFYYVPKASKTERGNGNNHPTVKPIKLMRYLVRLVTPPKGIVFDPFLGSGTTVIACVKEGFNYIGIEKESDYFKIAEKRISFYKSQPKLDFGNVA